MDVHLNPTPCMESLWLISQRGSSSGMQKITSKYTVSVCAFILNYAWRFSNLCDAKRQCLQQQGVIEPSMDAIEKATTRNELARHCKKKTRGAELTAQLIEELLLDMGTATDSFGVPVFNERVLTIWKEEIKHIPCIQDPPEVALYTVTGHIRKGSMELPVCTCYHIFGIIPIWQGMAALRVIDSGYTVYILVGSFQALQPVMCIFRPRAFQDGTRHRHWQWHSSRSRTIVLSTLSWSAKSV